MDREFIGSCRRWTFQSFVFSPLYTRNPFDMYTGSADFLQESQFQTGGIFAAVRSGHVQTLCCLSFIIPRVCAFAIITTLWSLVYTRAHGPALGVRISLFSNNIPVGRERVCSFFDFLVVFRGGLDLFLSLWPARSSCTSRTVAASTGGPTASFSTKCWSDSRRSTARMKRNSLPPSPTRTSPIRNHCPKKPKRFAKELVFI